MIESKVVNRSPKEVLPTPSIEGVARGSSVKHKERGNQQIEESQKILQIIEELSKPQTSGDQPTSLDTFQPQYIIDDSRSVLRKIRDRILYPSAKDVTKAMTASIGVSGVSVFSSWMGVPPELTFPMVIASLGVLVGEYTLLKIRTTKISDFMRLTKIASPTSRVFSEGHRVKKGDIIGELHIGNAVIERNFRPLGKYQRGMAVEKEALASFNTLATLCKNNDEGVKGIDVFYGRSDLVRRGGLLKRLGFEVETRGPLDQSFADRIVFRLARIRALGVREGINAPIGSINEAWITRENLGKLAK